VLLDITADELVKRLLSLPPDAGLCLLDSCGVGHVGSHLLIAGIFPRSVEDLSGDPHDVLARLDELLCGDLPVVFTLSYELGNKLNAVNSSVTEEPDLFAATFEALIVHDYDTAETRVLGDPSVGNDLEIQRDFIPVRRDARASTVDSNMSPEQYRRAVEQIQELIRSGETYQTNLTREITIDDEHLDAPSVFWRLRREHPTPFAAFLSRNNSTVVSASPERFFSLDLSSRQITTSPIKGTSPRAGDSAEDQRLRAKLATSAKDLAENTMIVDLMRNDLGRVCEFGSVQVEKLHDVEEHPTLFHLVSTVSGEVRVDTPPSDIIRALFPCGSITGAPKRRTMSIINEIEPHQRGLSMGGIGYYIPQGRGVAPVIDMSVAIRTMVIRGHTGTFHVGGGIVIDSDPADEYEETQVKSRALLKALDVRI
jgi:aminodeoxychorismate synthase component I